MVRVHQKRLSATLTEPLTLSIQSMPIAAPAQDKLRTIGTDAIIDMIYAGQSQAEIALAVGCDPALINRWLHADPQRSARARAAMAESAEAWIDRGHAYLVGAASDNAEIQRARALEQHCARRAAIRNPRYRDNVSVEHTGQVELRSITRRIIDTALPLVEDAQPSRVQVRALQASQPDSAADK